MNDVTPAGYAYLISRYSLDVCELFSRSYMTTRTIKKTEQREAYQETYFPLQRYAFDDSWQGQITFALKYEGVNVEVLRAFFAKVDAAEVSAFVQEHLLGGAQKRVWFLYEYLTGKKLDIPDGEGGSYLPLVDDELQFALPAESSIRNRRCHILNNLIGNSQFSPYIRKTAALGGDRTLRLKDESDRLLQNYSPELLYRAVQYLYVKETKSSFAIERETPDQKRMESFVGLLKGLGHTPLTKDSLVTAQNSVVDERYRQQTWRTDQVYVGETITPGYEKVHFIAPRPDAIGELMEGFLSCLKTWMAAKDADPIIVAAVMGFAFVFLHPFDDGNGRVHRYVLHAILAQLGFVPQGLIFPVSAVMLKVPRAYDEALESFSRRVMPRLAYEIDVDGEVKVSNDSRDFYRAVDYTPIVEYFQEVVATTIRTEWKAELDYLKQYDRMREAMRRIVDLPEKKANQFIKFVQQNGGELAQRKREFFAELTDDEIARLERVINGAEEPVA